MRLWNNFLAMPITPNAEIGANVRAELARAGRTQSDLAYFLGLAQPNVSRRLRGEVEFSASELLRTAAFLGVPATTLLEERAA